MSVTAHTEHGPDHPSADSDGTGGARQRRRMGAGSGGRATMRRRRGRPAAPNLPADPGGTGGEGRRRRSRSFILLRRIEADTPVHRLWAGTKLIGAAAVSLTVSLMPTWPAIAVMTALLLGGCRLAQVPWNAVPRPPIWFWIVVVGGGVLTVFSGGKPELAVGGAHIGVGDLDAYGRFVVVSFILLGAGATIGWTTSLGDIGPAVGRLLRPLKVIRVPVEEWATAIALCIRSLPLLVEEIRTLIAARRLRPKPPHREGVAHLMDEAGDLLVAALSVSLRRAADMAEAMTARGGTRSITARAPGPRRRDAVAMAVITGACTAAWLIPS